MKELRKLRKTANIPEIINLDGYNKEQRDKIYNIPADIFIPAAGSFTINEENVKWLISSGVKLVVEVANIPTTQAAERILRENKILVMQKYFIRSYIWLKPDASLTWTHRCVINNKYSTHLRI